VLSAVVPIAFVWGGDCAASATEQCVLVMDSDKQVSGEFSSF
jgi:hypothetical protein